MDENIAKTYGEHLADVYDQWFGSYEESAIALLAQLAQGGPALELGIGTGRIALPLAARGIEVHGIDGAPAMVAKLRARPGGDSSRASRRSSLWASARKRRARPQARSAHRADRL